MLLTSWHICMCIYIKYVSAHALIYHTHSALFWEVETMWKCLISVHLMRWHSSVAGAAIVGIRTVSTWHKGSLGSLPQPLFSYFFSPRLAGTAVGGEMQKAPPFFAVVVLHARDGTSQPTSVSWKKIQKEKRKRQAATFKAALSSALSSEVTFTRQRWSSGNLLSAPPPSVFSGLCQSSSQNTSSWTPGDFS